MDIGAGGFWVITMFCYAYLAISCAIITVSIIRSGLTGDLSG